MVTEILSHATNPRNVDSDADGLNDDEELMEHGTNPAAADTDGDGFSDSVEIRRGTDPLDPNSALAMPVLSSRMALLLMMALGSAGAMVSSLASPLAHRRNSPDGRRG